MQCIKSADQTDPKSYCAFPAAAGGCSLTPRAPASTPLALLLLLALPVALLRRRR